MGSITHALWKTWLQLRMTWLLSWKASLHIGHGDSPSPLATDFASRALPVGISRKEGRGGGYSFVASLSHVTIDHAFRFRGGVSVYHCGMQTKAAAGRGDVMMVL